VPIVATIVGLHLAILAALWFAAPWAAGPKPPARIDVALVAPPAPPKPAPPPPPPRVRQRRLSAIAQVATIAPAGATPLPLMSIVPPLLAPLPVESPITVIGSPVAAAPPPAPPPVLPKPVETVPPRFDAAYLDNPAPVYPASAKRAGEEGRVMLRVLVAADGRAQSVELAKTSGSERLDAAAIDAVRQWRFVAARRGDTTVAAYVIVPIVFSIRR